ncbi:regulatory protein RecX [Aequorivita sp. KMM 9714]|uniref:regulatory protein RecX n=1 Tax=Aequorivita sp. KMM 9714 TaxID=2707173 RepID=UPI0013EDE12C|nr:regulatory protein RecX [Aequorivita sp. KMM 9714]NGX82974.1 RecX family transcriptional regulator [Aequorivita sp. KMM 9714]
MNENKTYTVDEAKRRLERYCAYQERCHKEVQQKLYEMRMIPLAIDEIIDHLLRHNFLNETRFAQTFARGKFRTKKWGRNRIVNELKMRQISKFNIKIALKEIPDVDYYKTFETLAEKRIKQLESETNIQKKRKKLADYLFYRGWEPELVYAKINEILNK